MIAARHSAMAQQAALQAQARRLLAMQQPQQAPAPQQQQRSPGSAPSPAAVAAAQAQLRARAEAAAAARAPRQSEAPKIGRNDPCHCGSGKKYKNCHMRDDQAVPNG